MSGTRIKDFPLEVQQALREELMKYVGFPVGDITAIEIKTMFNVLLDFYDVPYRAELSFKDREMQLEFKPK